MLTTTTAGSWVWGVGDDWDQAKARTAGQRGGHVLGPNQTSQGNAANTSVMLNDTVPTTDHYDFATMEIIPGTPDTQPPTARSNLQASAPSSTEVDLTWSPSTDNVVLAGYDILRDGTQIGTSGSTSYQDLSVTPSTYNYTVKAYDASLNVSQPSNTAPITTPAPSNNPPVISNVSSTGITSSWAKITWTTDIPSSSRSSTGRVPRTT